MTNTADSSEPKQPGSNRWQLLMWGIMATILVLPFVAMRFTNEVRWTAFDFVAAGGLLIGAGAAFELTVRMICDAKFRLVTGGAILAIVMLIWAEGAVGIFQ